MQIIALIHRFMYADIILTLFYIISLRAIIYQIHETQLISQEFFSQCIYLAGYADISYFR